jgi:histidinol-phosphate aminotransferase
VDEAYGEFSDVSAFPLLRDHERLVIVRSFSKSWRLAGARIGYLLAHPWLVEAIQVARLPYHLSALTQACGEVALKHQLQIMRGIEEIVTERDRLSKELERVPGLEVFHSDANFILFKTPRDGTAVWHDLADAGILVRDFSQKIGRALRVTVGTSDQNATFVETLRSVLDAG